MDLTCSIVVSAFYKLNSNHKICKIVNKEQKDKKKYID